MVTLEPMSADRLAIWLPRLWQSYREELLRAGYSADAAEENIAQTIANTMPEGRFAEGQHVFEVRESGNWIGSVWLVERGREWFIYDIEIAEELRGRGHGRETMRRIEEFVRYRGGSVINLSVFGFNQVAQRLYTTEGYEVVRLSMAKRLD